MDNRRGASDDQEATQRYPDRALLGRIGPSGRGGDLTEPGRGRARRAQTPLPPPWVGT